MKSLSECTDDELAQEYSAAAYFETASDDPKTIKSAEKRMNEIEAEWDRRDAAKAAATT